MCLLHPAHSLYRYLCIAMRLFGLIDCNNFFVSCERVRHPELKGKPVIVLSGDDGCAVALSNEAKALGIHRGDPLFRIRDICTRHNVASPEADHRFYAETSARVMAVLRSLSDEPIEIYSIDEAFMPVDTSLGDLNDYGRYVVGEIDRQTGVPVSLGIARTKTLAKIATHFAKKYPGYHGVCLMDTEEKEMKALTMTPVGEIWGIGPRIAKRLTDRGIVTARDFFSLDETAVSRLLNKSGHATWQELHGIPGIRHADPSPEKQSVSVSRTFARDTYSLDEITQAVCSFVASASAKLRRKGLVARDITVSLRTNRFHPERPQHNADMHLRLADHTDFTPDLTRAATEVLKKLFRRGYAYKRAGITLHNLRRQAEVQRSLFADPAADSKRRRLMQVMDRLNTGCGSANPNIRIAALGDGLGDLATRTSERKKRQNKPGGKTLE